MFVNFNLSVHFKCIMHFVTHCIIVMQHMNNINIILYHYMCKVVVHCYLECNPGRHINCIAFQFDLHYAFKAS